MEWGCLLLAVGLPLIFGDKMKMKWKMNGALWVAGGSMAGGGLALHGFSLYLNVA